MSEAKRKILGLFRSRSTSDQPNSKNDKERDRARDWDREKDRDRYKDRKERRHRREHDPKRPSHHHHHHDLDHERSDSSQSRHTKSEHGNSHRRASGSQLSASIPIRASPIPAPQPLTEWPPSGFTWHDALSQGKAMELIASGVPVFKGIKHSIPHAAEEYYNLYATCVGNGGAGSDIAPLYNEAFAANSLRLQGEEKAAHPWETLEQPSQAFLTGQRPGTITLTHWVNLSGKVNPPIELRDPALVPRDVELFVILERLIYLEGGFEEEYEDLMYKNLYRNLLRDPDRILSPHKAMEKQISDLIIVLSRREWIDFSKPENQVVAKFFANATYTEQGRYKLFFHQLLLSMELYLRIHSKQHAEFAKEKLLAQLPPCIRWDLALVRRWRECMSIQKFSTGENPQQIRFQLRIKKAQVKALRKFARAMKWPNLAKVDEVLKERDVDDVALEDRSSDAMSYFTGMILPGKTMPWLIMNSLIDCDSDAGGNSLAALTHMHPHSGFQYRSQTYWSSTSIVGKVLAPTCREIGGWIGPARPAPDLSRIQIARIRQRRPKQRLTVSDIESMTERSDCLGPPSEKYPVSEYQLLLPDHDPYSIVNTIRIEKLALKPINSSPSPASPSPPHSPSSCKTSSKETSKDSGKPLTFDAAVQFAIDGKSWPLRLSYDVSFISAYPCSRGPHPLFFDYVYLAVKIDELLQIRDWGGLNMNGNGSVNPAGSSTSSPSRVGGDGEGGERGGERDEGEDEEKVLVVEAFGVKDNEVLARAWCSHWGLSAVVADVERTCMACAIREAYAACLNVVILIDGDTYESDS